MTTRLIFSPSLPDPHSPLLPDPHSQTRYTSNPEQQALYTLYFIGDKKHIFRGVDRVKLILSIVDASLSITRDLCSRPGYQLIPRAASFRRRRPARPHE